MGEKKYSKDGYIETATPLREDGLFISLGCSKFLELELFAPFCLTLSWDMLQDRVCAKTHIDTLS